MKNPIYKDLIEQIKETQDNNILKEGDEVSDVILTTIIKNRVGKNAHGSNRDEMEINAEAASIDLGYFIDQLTKAKKVLDSCSE
jgi:hypothetical protein